MFTITVFHGAIHLTYKSNILPQLGDFYPKGCLFDDNQYTVVGRLLSLQYDCLITIIVEYSYPDIVKETLPELDEAVTAHALALTDNLS